VLTPTTSAGREALSAIKADPLGCLAAFDYDGTLAPIVDDPSWATPEPGAIAALTKLSRCVGVVAVITGRPAQIAVDLAGFEGVEGLSKLVVVGHYGLERWDASTGEFGRSTPPPGLAVVRAELPDLLASLDLEDAVVEDKGLSVAVHVRRLAEPDKAFAAMQEPLSSLAKRNGLEAEPGRRVIELRPPGMDKGVALRALVEETRSRSVIFTGDDLGDLAAFAEVEQLRTNGVPGLLVCSGSAEVTALAFRADLVVDGPSGVTSFVGAFVDVLRNQD
jgi:trehalose 6-phosphate phosphatase